MKVNVLQAAKYLADKSVADSITDLTPLKLQKILYYVEGWYLGNDKDGLFYEAPLAWQYGPVYRILYDRFKGKEPECVKPADFADVDGIDSLELKEDIDQVWNAYKHKTATELVALTHQTPPWRAARQNKVSDVINKNHMKEYFHKLAHRS